MKPPTAAKQPPFGQKKMMGDPRRLDKQNGPGPRGPGGRPQGKPPSFKSKGSMPKKGPWGHKLPPAPKFSNMPRGKPPPPTFKKSKFGIPKSPPFPKLPKGPFGKGFHKRMEM